MTNEKGDTDNGMAHDDGQRLRTFHLFAGAGGGVLADLLLGHVPVGACEIEDYPRAVLLQRQRDGILPAFPVWDDICTLEGKPWRGLVDVVAGGFPCTDLSCAGKGAGIEGERSGLWTEMARVIGEIQPRYVFVENSPMLTSRGLGRVLGDLVSLGYNSRRGGFSAYHAGAFHNRSRIWIVAYPKRYEEWEKSRRRKAGRMGRKLQQVPWDRPCKRALRELRGMDDGMARVVDRTDAIRNGQVPAVAALAWQILTQ